jgi:predicted MPP superfamily phosphohydrolase
VVFAGHYHAGQFRIPYIGSVVVPSTYGRRFDHGHFIVNGTHLFATSGIGVAVLPFRIYCQPDIFIVDVMETTG